jgi:hypothetical protein
MSFAQFFGLGVFGLGGQEVIILFLCLLLVVWPFWLIFSKAGYPGWLSVGMVLPIVNLVLIFFLALSDWPALRRPGRSLEAEPPEFRP